MGLKVGLEIQKSLHHRIQNTKNSGIAEIVAGANLNGLVESRGLSHQGPSHQGPSHQGPSYPVQNIPSLLHGVPSGRENFDSDLQIIADGGRRGDYFSGMSSWCGVFIILFDLFQYRMLWIINTKYFFYVFGGGHYPYEGDGAVSR